MLLNEDFFKDLEITDDDITVDDELHDNDEVEDPNKTFSSMLSEYENCISIHIKGFLSIFTYEEYRKWEIAVPNMLKRLNALLDAYDIEHSVPFFLDDKIVRYYSHDFSKYKILDFKGNRILTLSDELPRNAHLILTMYVNLPKFKTFKTAYRFVRYLVRCVWKNSEDYDEFTMLRLLRKSYDSFTNININPSDNTDSDECLSISYIKADYVIDYSHQFVIYEILLYFFKDRFRELYMMLDDYTNKRNTNLIDCVK